VVWLQNRRGGEIFASASGGRSLKKFAVLFAGVVALWVFAGDTSAQGFLGSYGTSNLTGLSFRWPNSVCDAVGNPECGLMTTPRMYFGRLEHYKGSRWALERQLSTGTAPWPLRGFWLGASKDFTLDNGLGFLICGSVFFPQPSAGAWYTEPSATTISFQIPSFDWWSLDCLGKCRISGNLEFLAGFRYDHMSTRVNYSDITDDDYILNAYMPLFGLQVQQPISNGSILLRFTGAPAVGGQLKYHFWDNLGYAEFANFNVTGDYFMEFFADCCLNIRDGLGLGAFAKWNSLHLKTASQRLSGSTTESVLWAVNIQSWTVGASLYLGFYSPI